MPDNEEIHWTRHFGPISGSDPKLAHPDERYVITSFAYGTNMGAAQMAKHMRGIISAHEITFVNRRHITLDKLEAAKADLINRYFPYDLPKSWGDENIAAADGTKIDLYENNLLSSYHIRFHFNRRSRSVASSPGLLEGKERIFTLILHCKV